MQQKSKEKIAGNLKACGCNKATTAQLISELESGNTTNALAILSDQRKSLLDRFHRCNDCIMNLDYLISQLKKGDQI